MVHYDTCWSLMSLLLYRGFQFWGYYCCTYLNFSLKPNCQIRTELHCFRRLNLPSSLSFILRHYIDIFPAWWSCLVVPGWILTSIPCWSWKLFSRTCSEISLKFVRRSIIWRLKSVASRSPHNWIRRFISSVLFSVFANHTANYKKSMFSIFYSSICLP